MNKDPAYIYGKKQRERENPKETKPKVVKTGGKTPATKKTVNPKSVKSNPKIPGAGSGSTSNPSTSPTRMNKTRPGMPTTPLPYGPFIPTPPGGATKVSTKMKPRGGSGPYVPPKPKSTKTSFSAKKGR